MCRNKCGLDANHKQPLSRNEELLSDVMPENVADE
jgi:hypothetical protein